MKRRSQFLIGGLLILLGVLWLLDTAELLDVWRWGVIAPLLLIGVGLWRIVTAFGGAERDAVHGSVDTFVLLSDRHLHCEGPFEGGSIAAVLADVDLDLRGATPAASKIELSATTILADLDIVVPVAWRVRVDGPVILADVKVPDEAPRPDDEAGAAPDDRPELLIRAFSVLGDLTVHQK
ncbi:MAG: hypothetical protein EA389_13075 [Ilumatobacter sp.]|nr:MAG: hypothetical protein EA389_13075 [Ilumatobacter sp.]